MKGNWQKNMHCSGLLFYRSLKLIYLHLFWPRLQYSYEAGFTILHTYAYIVHKVSLEHYFVAVYLKDILVEKRQGNFLGALLARSTTFEHFCGKRLT